MSVRAYKIEKISDKPSFNVWHTEIDVEEFDIYVSVGGDIAYIIVDRDTLNELKKKYKDNDMAMDDLKRIEADMGTDNAVEYTCY